MQVTIMCFLYLPHHFFSKNAFFCIYKNDFKILILPFKFRFLNCNFYYIRVLNTSIYNIIEDIIVTIILIL